MQNDNTIDFDGDEDINNTHFPNSFNHFGQDLSGQDSSLGIMSDFRDITVLNTPSSGKRKLFIVGSSNDLIHLEITSRISLDIKGPITFIESSQLFCAKSSCWCNVVAFRPINYQSWRLGILQAIHVLNTSKQILLFEWIGPVTELGMPDFVHDKIISDWSDIAHHFIYKVFSCDSVELLFVNQVRGIPIGNLPISDNCRSEVDGGIQCSVDGPDVFKPTVPIPSWKNHSELENLFDSIELQYDEVPFSKTYFENMNIKRR